MVQMELIPRTAWDHRDTSTTFLDNMKLPVHRWFRLSAGFSAQWVEQTIINFQKETGGQVNLLDPFTGSGTTLLAAGTCGVWSWGIEAQPFLFKIASAKLCWQANVNGFVEFANRVYQLAQGQKGTVGTYPSPIHKCFPDDALAALDTLGQAWIECNDESDVARLTWLAITAILRISSPVGTAQMELIQPRKTKKNFVHPFEAFRAQIAMMSEDMVLFQNRAPSSKATLISGDARTDAGVKDGSITLAMQTQHDWKCRFGA